MTATGIFQFIVSVLRKAVRLFPVRAILREVWHPSGLPNGRWGWRRVVRRLIVATLMMPVILCTAGCLALTSLKDSWSLPMGRGLIYAVRLGGQGPIEVKILHNGRAVTLIVPGTKQTGVEFEYEFDRAATVTPSRWSRRLGSFGVESGPQTLVVLLNALFPGGRSRPDGLAIPWRYMIRFPVWAPAVAAGLIVGYACLAFVRGPWRRARRSLAGFCLRCGYNLTGLPEPRCPECGTRVA